MNIKLEEKRRIYEDINAKLAFGKVTLLDTDSNNTIVVDSIYWNKNNDMNFQILCNGKWIKYDFQRYKLYLRPMLSMTDSEGTELLSKCFMTFDDAKNFNFDLEFKGIVITDNKKTNFVGCDVILKLINYLDSHNFDIRGLLETDFASPLEQE